VDVSVRTLIAAQGQISGPDRRPHGKDLEWAYPGNPDLGLAKPVMLMRPPHCAPLSDENRPLLAPGAAESPSKVGRVFFSLHRRLHSGQ